MYILQLWNDILMVSSPFELSPDIIQEWEIKIQEIIIPRTENQQVANFLL